MVMHIVGEMLVLFGLGISGWLILARLRVPAPEIIGPIVVIGAFRTLQVNIPTSPDFLFQGAQIIIGIFVGAMLTRDTLRQLKAMVLAALIIIAWALSIAFLVGFFLARYSALDLYTAMLAASMGGLPEITVIALASGATVAVIIVMQMFRMLGTVMLFPVMLGWLKRIEGRVKNSMVGEKDRDPHGKIKVNAETTAKNNNDRGYLPRAKRTGKLLSRDYIDRLGRSIKTTWLRVSRTVFVASLGGVLFELLGVPAGLLVGSIIFVAAISIAGMPVSTLSPRLFDLLLVLIGITVADNIDLETFATMADADFLVPILAATLFMFATSFAVAWIIHRLTGWDFPTSFLAAAPGGFTVMTALAIKHGLDPFKVSMLHLCRLLSINLIIPFVFIILMNR